MPPLRLTVAVIGFLLAAVDVPLAHESVASATTPHAPGSVSVRATSATVGTAHTFTITYNSPHRKVSGTVRVKTPAHWPWAQTRSTKPGYIQVRRGTCTDATLVAPERYATGSTLLQVKVRCKADTSFRLIWHDVTVPQTAGRAVFSASAKLPPWAEYLTFAHQPVVTLNPAAATRLRFANGVTATDAGQPLSPVPTVQILDRYGNLTGSTGPVHLTLLSGQTPDATLSGKTTRAAVSGVASFNDVAVTRSGTEMRLQAASGTLSPATTAPFTIHGGWIRTASMNDARAQAAAIKLVDGRVLVAGGVAADASALGSAEIYDPGNGVWTDTGNLSQARASAAGVLLADGRVLLAGGRDGTGAWLDSAEIYDPATGAWTAAAAMPGAPENVSATLLKDGRVMVNGDVSPHPFLYDPTTDTWATSAADNDTGARPTYLTTLRDGRVFSYGLGSYGYLWDPDTDAWTQTTMFGCRVFSAFTTLRDGRILGTSGFCNGNQLYADTRYDPTTDTADSPIGPHEYRWSATAVTLPDGRVMLAGGVRYDGWDNEASSTSEERDATTGAWRIVPTSFGLGRNDSNLVVLDDGRVLLVGGQGYGTNAAQGPTATAELYQ